ncbi:hypothetical protein L1987_42748 [Smallanthus sonchifolius]|uniref:Uncharacterized protein n=1 Tax=Smallanthus sonchifolius TaxID=185202 RepID=A0ACB9GJT9_9ASTR|nr:hypothetical protein L1987_42748 [Smallanthus sonchifolius]
MIFLPSLPFHTIDNTGDPSMVKLRFPFGNPEGKKITIVGSINGIILLLIKNSKILISDQIIYDHDMILYNPFSREFKTVPYYPPSFDHSIVGSINCVYGFGYGYGHGTIVDDLKIVRLGESIVNHRSVSYEVFDLKTWSWSRHSEIGKYSLGFFLGTFANGFLYWHVWSKKVNVLSSFGLAGSWQQYVEYVESLISLLA